MIYLPEGAYTPADIYTQSFLTWPFDHLAIDSDRLRADQSHAAEAFNEGGIVRVVGTVGLASRFSDHTALHWWDEEDRLYEIDLGPKSGLEVMSDYLTDVRIDAHVDVEPSTFPGRGRGKLLGVAGIEQPFKPGMESGRARAIITSFEADCAEAAKTIQFALDPSKKQLYTTTPGEPVQREIQVYHYPKFYGRCPKINDVVGIRIRSVHEGGLVDIQDNLQIIHPAPQLAT